MKRLLRWLGFKLLMMSGLDIPKEVTRKLIAPMVIERTITIYDAHSAKFIEALKERAKQLVINRARHYLVTDVKKIKDGYNYTVRLIVHRV